MTTKKVIHQKWQKFQKYFKKTIASYMKRNVNRSYITPGNQAYQQKDVP